MEAETVKSHAQDLLCLLEEGDFTQSKSFLRSFVKKVIINGDKAKIMYRIPVTPDGKRSQSVGVLPIEPFGGAGGIRTPYLLTASQTFSQVNYGPIENNIIV